MKKLKRWWDAIVLYFATLDSEPLKPETPKPQTTMVIEPKTKKINS